MNGIQEVRGSIPLISTKKKVPRFKRLGTFSLLFALICSSFLCLFAVLISFHVATMQQQDFFRLSPLFSGDQLSLRPGNALAALLRRDRSVPACPWYAFLLDRHSCIPEGLHQDDSADAVIRAKRGSW